MTRYRLRMLLQEFDLPPGETLLGRSPECHVTIEDPLVSRAHATIVVAPDRVIFRDLGSRNGSRINGKTIQGEQELLDGDRIRIGTQELMFSRVVSPRRPGRPTGSLRYCTRCKMPYPAEVPSCAHCGFTQTSEEETVIEPEHTPPHGSAAKAWPLDLHAEFLNKALSLGRLTDAERALQRIVAVIDELLETKEPLPKQSTNTVLIGAIRFAVSSGVSTWFSWSLTTLERSQLLPGEALLSQLEQVPVSMWHVVLPTFERYVAALVKERETQDLQEEPAAIHLRLFRLLESLKLAISAEPQR